MKLFDTEGQERGFQRIARTYADIVRAGMVLVTWTLIGLVGLAAAFVAGRLVWSLLMLALRWIGRI
jgi:hypothetical protein